MISNPTIDLSIAVPTLSGCCVRHLPGGGWMATALGPGDDTPHQSPVAFFEQDDDAPSLWRPLVVGGSGLIALGAHYPRESYPWQHLWSRSVSSPAEAAAIVRAARAADDDRERRNGNLPGYHLHPRNYWTPMDVIGGVVAARLPCHRADCEVMPKGLRQPGVPRPKPNSEEAP